MATLHPPPQYDVPPQMPVIEHVLSYDEVQKICGRITGMILPQGGFWNGCARPPGVFVPTDLHAVGDVSKMQKPACEIWYTGTADTLRHEKAHCNGWPANHPGGW